MTAQPKYTIVRYRANDADMSEPVTVSRWRFFEDATHFDVTGEHSKGAAHWTRQWTCESLSMEGGKPHWRINGRSEWEAPEDLIAHLARLAGGLYGTWFETYDAAKTYAHSDLVRAADRTHAKAKECDRKALRLRQSTDPLAAVAAPASTTEGAP